MYNMARCDSLIKSYCTALPVCWRRCVHHTWSYVHAFHTRVVVIFSFEFTRVPVYWCLNFNGITNSVKFCWPNGDFHWLKRSGKVGWEVEFNEFLSIICLLFSRLVILTKYLQIGGFFTTFLYPVLLLIVHNPGIDKLWQNHYWRENKTLTSSCAVGKGLVIGPAALAGPDSLSLLLN